MASAPVDQSAFVAEKIAVVFDAMSSLMATIHRLELRGFDTTDAKDRLERLAKELAAWKSMHITMLERAKLPCMSYVITYGSIENKKSVSCESATEALAIVEHLSQAGADSIMVTSYQIENEAIPNLKVLENAEKY